jgi:hypothetical protein
MVQLSRDYASSALETAGSKRMPNNTPCMVDHHPRHQGMDSKSVHESWFD